MPSEQAVFLGDVRASLTAEFWMTCPGRTFLRMLDDVTLEDLLRQVLSLVPQLDAEDDNTLVRVDNSQTPVCAPADAFWDVMHTSFGQAAILARGSVNIVGHAGPIPAEP